MADFGEQGEAVFLGRADLQVKNTFIHFAETPQVLNRALSCPDMTFVPECPASQKRGTINFEKEGTSPVAASVQGVEDSCTVTLASSDAPKMRSDVTPVPGCSQDGRVIVLHNMLIEAVGTGWHRDKVQEPGDLMLQKQINKELIEAANAANGAHQLLFVAANRLEQMNGFNISTALHRLARFCRGQTQLIELVHASPAFHSLLQAAEAMVLSSVVHKDGRMPPNCCTILAWSCASLSLFQGAFFTLLTRAAGGCLDQCEPYEVTNFLWAFAEMNRCCKKKTDEVKDALQGALNVVAPVLLQRNNGIWTMQVLSSCLVSIVSVPWQSISKRLFLSVASELALRQEELAKDTIRPVHVAFKSLASRQAKAFKQIAIILRADWPCFAQQFIPARSM
mmetsp:Transcript_62550/g.146719  ORF Transcript_62550/g.146719 Transcript_62550/m.146719 type:complete len:394 (+) Transcript_62550:51-1232(+)